VVSVRFNDPDNLATCENFLRHAFPGQIERNGRSLALTFHAHSLTPAAQREVIERLLWAWRVSHHVSTNDGYVDSPEQNRGPGSYGVDT
jgi:hypothetical protein